MYISYKTTIKYIIMCVKILNLGIYSSELYIMGIITMIIWIVNATHNYLILWLSRFHYLQVSYNSQELQGAAWRSGLHVWLVMWRSWVSSPIKGPRCFGEQETSPLLLSNGWFQERIRAWFRNQLECQISSLVKYRQN